MRLESGGWMDAWGAARGGWENRESGRSLRRAMAACTVGYHRYLKRLVTPLLFWHDKDGPSPAARVSGPGSGSVSGRRSPSAPQWPGSSVALEARSGSKSVSVVRLAGGRGKERGVCGCGGGGAVRRVRKGTSRPLLVALAAETDFSNAQGSHAARLVWCARL